MKKNELKQRKVKTHELLRPLQTLTSPLRYNKKHSALPNGRSKFAVKFLPHSYHIPVLSVRHHYLF